MTPSITAVKAVNPDVRLAEKAAESLKLPGKTPKQIVNDLLGRLKRLKHRRDLRGLNHWSSYSNVYVRELVERHEVRRQMRIADFIATRHTEVLARALTITRNRENAERVVARTYLEWVQGRTEEKFLHRALKMNARDLLGKRATELRRYESMDGLASAPGTVRLSTSAALEFQEGIDFTSQRLEDQDPLDILIARDEQREFNDEMEYALRVVRCRGNREVLKRKWWQESAIGEWEKKQHGLLRGGNKKRMKSLPATAAQALFGGSPE